MVTYKEKTQVLENPTDMNKLEHLFMHVLKPVVDKHAEKLDAIIENNKKLDTQEEV